MPDWQISKRELQPIAHARTDSVRGVWYPCSLRKDSRPQHHTSAEAVEGEEGEPYNLDYSYTVAE